MTERQLRYRLHKEGYLLMKRGDGYMIVEMNHNFAIAGGHPFAYSFSLDDVVEWIDEYFECCQSADVSVR